MTLVNKNLIYRITMSCGCPLWLSSATFLLITIIYLIKSLFSYTCHPGEYSEDVKYGWSVFPIRLTAEVLELGFALLALWGIVKKKPLLLLPYILWSIILMVSLGYVIYLVYKERTSSQEVYNGIAGFILYQNHKPSSIGIIEMLLCIPIVFKGFTTTIVYTYFRSMVASDLQDQNKVDLKDIKVIIRKQVNEAVTSHMNKIHHPYVEHI